MSSNDELCIKNEELSIKNQDFCIENDFAGWEFRLVWPHLQTEYGWMYVRAGSHNAIQWAQDWCENDEFCIKTRNFVFQMMYFAGGGTRWGTTTARCTAAQAKRTVTQRSMFRLARTLGFGCVVLDCLKALLDCFVCLNVMNLQGLTANGASDKSIAESVSEEGFFSFGYVGDMLSVLVHTCRD